MTGLICEGKANVCLPCRVDDELPPSCKRAACVFIIGHRYPSAAFCGINAIAIINVRDPSGAGNDWGII